MLTITHATAKGRRPYQEDTYFFYTNSQGTLAAVFDGHGGDDVSTLCKNYLSGEPLFEEDFEDDDTVLIDFPKKLVTSKTPGWDVLEAVQPPKKLKELFENLNVLTASYRQGSTASVVWIPKTEKKAYIAVLGDSPIIVRTRQGTISISPEHNVRSNPKEAAAAEARGGILSGGYVWNDLGDLGDGLQMTRALGDKSLNKILDRNPEIYTVDLGKNSWILVGTDGILDPGHKDHEARVSHFVDLIENQNADAARLVDDAVKLPTHDNATAVLLRKK